MVDVADKREFLVWLINNVPFQRREVVWILNYLINHEAILKNVHVVEQAEKTERGIVFRDASQEKMEPMMLTVSGQNFASSDQIFHEIRLHWQQPLYIECIFPNPWQNALYLSVLEDNPAISWNDSVSAETINEVESYMEKEAQQATLKHLYQQIDQALEDGDQDTFVELSNEINRLKLLIKEKEVQ
ncbi:MULTISPECIES: YpiB family protein [Enterococcus]|uniref:YpiB family protein n=1 Tax=Enterococcus alishanensis TaxID=1303817 RepID=A0ABS6TAT1_9ENTE|nr:YpiB family protein [Enterococcus alishanensis]MBV7390011.1 YpiB family protein [Enterococcus alishanensis]